MHNRMTRIGGSVEFIVELASFVLLFCHFNYFATNKIFTCSGSKTNIANGRYMFICRTP